MLRAIHRDIGYFCVGLTLVYALSGILLNHLREFNSNYRLVRTALLLPQDALQAPVDEGAALRLLEAVGETRPYRSFFQAAPGQLRIFVDGGVVDVDLATGQALREEVGTRPVLKRLNDLHLNRAGRAWTWLTDLFSAALGLLALSGLFLVAGKGGFARRGWWMVGLGILLPLLWALLLP